MKRFDEELCRIAERTFESLAFMLPVPPEEAPPTHQQVAVTASFHGPFTGTLLMHVETALTLQLAQNLLGLCDEEPTPDQQDDALKELLNVLCGNLLPEIAGPGAVFDIDAPRILGAAQPVAADPNESASVKLYLDAGTVEMWLTLPGAASAAA